MTKSTTLFALPYIRWAHKHAIGASAESARTRRQLCDHLLIYFLAGKGNIWVDGKIYDVDPDTLFFLAPGSWYDFPPSAEGYTFASVHYDVCEMPDSARFAPFRTAEDQSATLRPVQFPSEWMSLPNPYLHVKTRSRIRRLVEEILYSFEQWDEVSRFEASGLLAALIAQVSREIRTSISIEQHESVGADAIRRVHKARQMLEDIAVPRDLAEVADAVDGAAVICDTCASRCSACHQIIFERLPLFNTPRPCSPKQTSELPKLQKPAAWTTKRILPGYSRKRQVSRRASFGIWYVRNANAWKRKS